MEGTMKGIMQLGKCEVMLAGRVVGTVDSIVFDIEEATPEELCDLMLASSVTLIRHGKYVTFTPSQEDVLE